MEPRLAELTEQVRKQQAARTIAQLIFLRSQKTSAEEQIATARTFTGSGDVYRLTKAAIEAGGADSGAWGAEMATWNRLAAEWISTVSARTVLGRLNTVRVPFRTLTGIESGGATASYGTIPAGALSFTTATALERLHIGTICGFSGELFRTWRPGTAENINAVLRRTVQRGLDAAALDPDSAAVAGEKPASLLNGVSPLGDLTQTTAGALADVQTMINAMIDAGSDLQDALFVAHPRTAAALSVLNTSGVLTFPGVTPVGGSICGIPLATSVSAIRSGSPLERVFALLDGSRIMTADDGEVEFTPSRVTSVEMDTSPGMEITGTPTAANVVSAFQTESVFVKAVRFMNFAKANSTAACWMTSTF